MSVPIEKARRQKAVLDLLGEEVIASQEDLRLALKRRGFPVAQATLSRDLKELRVPCVPTGAGYRYALPEEAAGLQAPAPEPAAGRMQNVASLEVTGIDANEVAVVVRTLQGRAQGVAVYVDGLKLPDVMATVAGDDTILVLPRSVRRIAKVRRELASILGLD